LSDRDTDQIAPSFKDRNWDITHVGTDNRGYKLRYNLSMASNCVKLLLFKEKWLEETALKYGGQL